jgi:type IV pilus assembly protein PilA
MHPHRKRTNPRGFTLLEILLVVAAIAILAGIVIVAINPARQLGDTRDAQRLSDVNAIANALVQYYIKNGRFPTEVPTAQSSDTCSEISGDDANGICTESEECDGYSLDTALVSGDYLGAIPRDPLSASDANPELSGYYAAIVTSRVLVCAPYAEISPISARQ